MHPIAARRTMCEGIEQVGNTIADRARERPA
jgi:hypothetical protein